MVLKLFIIAASGYLLGNLNGAILISRLVQHDDVRSHGSGNAGFTNFFRNYGGLTSLLVIFIDAVKAVAACALGRFLLAPQGLGLEGAVLAALSVGIGHDFPALLGFHGGKGIVCGFASTLMLDWRVSLLAFVVFAGVYLTTKYVSLSSVLAALSLGVSFLCWHIDRPWAVAGCLAMVALAIAMHRENILRLLHKTERKTDFFKKENRE